MTNYLETRTTVFSNVEFTAIPRNADGDIIDIEDAYPFITNAQRERLTDDDYSRCEEMDEGLRYMAEEFL